MTDLSHYIIYFLQANGERYVHAHGSPEGHADEVKCMK